MEKKVKCDLCLKVMFKKYIKRHEENHIKNPKPEEKKEFKCVYCHKTYAAKLSLQNHIDVVHKKLRKHKCNICDKAFTDPTPLRQHILRHEADPNIRPFRCHLCDLSYMLELHL